MMQKAKDFWNNLSNNMKKALIAGAIGVVAVVCIAAVALNAGSTAAYAPLFQDLNQEEAQQIIGLLQEQGVDYQYDSQKQNILVPQEIADKTRADLISRGYPKSGFTYDIYRDNAGLMTTESDKKQYTVYDLQDRLGATIRLFDGVQDAKVTISIGTEQKYALESSKGTDASASVVITMKDGRSVSPEQASGIQNLVARSVNGLTFTNVSVFDAKTMMEVSTDPSKEDGLEGTKSLTELTSIVETNIANNVKRLLEQLYGPGKVEVSVKGTLNMDKLVRESIEYTVPAQTDPNNREGLLSQESSVSENSGTAVQGAGGVPGTETNADVPRYTNNGGTRQQDTYSNSSVDREWLFNTVRSQEQIDPGVLEDATIGVVINTEDQTIPQEDLINLVANSSGIPVEEAPQKITIVRSPRLTGEPAEGEAQQVASDETEVEEEIGLIPIIAVVGAGLLILLILLLILAKRAKKKRMEDARALADELLEQDDMIPADFPQDSAMDPAAYGYGFHEDDPEVMAHRQRQQEMDAEIARNEEIINLRMQRSLKLKENIREFVDENPQIAAKLLQTWLRGEEKEK